VFRSYMQVSVEVSHCQNPEATVLRITAEEILVTNMPLAQI